MSEVSVQLEDEVVALLRQFNQPIQRSVRELVVLELYRRSSISSGKAAQLLEMSRSEFIQFASRLGLPYFALNQEEWEAEVAQSQKL